MKGLLSLLALVINNDALQDQAAGPVAKLLVEAIPDSEEDAIAHFLHKVATKLEQAHA